MAASLLHVKAPASSRGSGRADTTDADHDRRKAQNTGKVSQRDLMPGRCADQGESLVEAAVKVLVADVLVRFSVRAKAQLAGAFLDAHATRGTACAPGLPVGHDTTHGNVAIPQTARGLERRPKLAGCAPQRGVMRDVPVAVALPAALGANPPIVPISPLAINCDRFATVVLHRTCANLLKRTRTTPASALGRNGDAAGTSLLSLAARRAAIAPSRPIPEHAVHA
mmetsp:Transcript_17488/g.47891  ORF Transcript_17488/g.47891 Transcript_17488/m.47891 type:complete len:225 (-) Transcript_17488:1312-1986(-)